MLDQFSIRDWDLLLIGDGSGNAWNDCCGWATILIDRLSRHRWSFHGGMNMGSINLAELMPYMQALSWFHQHAGRGRLHEISRPLSVHVISDSQVIVSQGNQTADPQQDLPKHQSPQWAAMRHLSRMGYVIKYHWANRSKIALNRLADQVAGDARRAMQRRLAPVTEAQIWEAERAEQGCRDVLISGINLDSDAGRALLAASRTLQTLLQQHATPSQLASQFIETAAARDSHLGLIDPYQINPDS